MASMSQRLRRLRICNRASMYLRALLIEKRHLQRCPIVGDDPQYPITIRLPEAIRRARESEFRLWVALDRIVVFRVDACTPAGGGL